MPTYYDTARLRFSQKRLLILAQTFVLLVRLQDLLDGLLRRWLVTGLHVRLVLQRIYMITRRVRHRYVQTRKDIYIKRLAREREKVSERERERGKVRVNACYIAI